MIKKILWILSDWIPVGFISYRQARHLAEDLYEWWEIAGNRDEYPVGNQEDRRESIVYGNCAGQIEATLGRRRLVKWQQKWGNDRF